MNDELFGPDPTTPDIGPTTARDALKAPIPENDAYAETIGEYLIELLAVLWEQQESFSGKRPFGNSGWTYDLLTGLVRAGLIPGSLDEDGFSFDCDREAGHRLIAAAIRQLGHTAAHAEAEQLRYERRLLGVARRTLDLVAAGGPDRWDEMRNEAEDVAQRIVDEIGHPVTDEPALGPSYRDKLARIRAILEED